MTDAAPSAESQDHSIAEAVAGGFPAAVAELGKLVRIPSVSWPAFDAAHVAASADAVAELLRGTGVFDTVEVKRAQKAGFPDGELGHPAVLATRAARNGRPTVLLYAHHDVQPPGDEANWQTTPFEPTVVGDRLYGRGAADDKAGVVSHLAAIRALAETADPLELGLSVFIEGEEEHGSHSFVNFLEDNRDALAADVIVVADSDNWDTETPNLTVALRGACAFNLTVTTLGHASHSGMWGGAAPDAMLAAIKLLSTLWDENGSVAVSGLTHHDAPTPPFDEAELAASAAFVDGVRAIGTGSVLDRLWFQPSITVTGIDAPSIANASNTLVPSVTVRISMRVAPGQASDDARDALLAHLEANAPFGAQLSFSDIEGGDPFLVDTDGWAAQAAKQAMTDAWGKAPVEAGIGGSIPFIADLVRVFPDAQILVTGVEDPDTRAHSPNESLHLGVFRRAILTEALLLSRLNRNQA
ncbi:dipeptidase [Gryllotalpicola protaetiae]|uniref:Dipeptidase n=1 Tax=Gryllotalpicola protaetiae TaxID=2419771 RepID=A0A387BRQ9_9MICO|nr:dipeptidase [Gryllotalpicola protaetiae]AYG04774.1 dipeptidase [Gryllotalpicola protaetiae]